MKHEDRNKPTRWTYDNGEPVPLWHAVQTLDAHFCFGYVFNLQSQPRERCERNGNPDFQRAQLAGWDAAERDRVDIRAKGKAWAEAQIPQMLVEEQPPGG